MAITHVGAIPYRKWVALVPLALVGNVVVAFFAWWLVAIGI
jgi:hypothetical protein